MDDIVTEIQAIVPLEQDWVSPVSASGMRPWKASALFGKMLSASSLYRRSKSNVDCSSGIRSILT